MFPFDFIVAVKVFVILPYSSVLSHFFEWR